MSIFFIVIKEVEEHRAAQSQTYEGAQLSSAVLKIKREAL